MKKRDAEVRTHEEAHVRAASGVSVSGPNFTFATGPDSKQYVTDGNVDIDTAKVEGDPEATIEKAKKIQASALAPVEPSEADRKVATAARQMEMDAKREISEANREQSTLYNDTGQNQEIGRASCRERV